MQKVIVVIFHESSLSGANLAILETIKVIELEYEFIFILNSYGVIIEKLQSIKTGKDIIIKDYRWWVSSGLPKFKFYKLRITIRNLIACRDIVRVLKNRRIDYILSNTITISIGPFIAYILKKKHLWYLHEYGREDHGLRFIYGNLFSFWFMKNYGGKLIANSLTLSKYFEKRIKRQISYLYCLVDMDEGYFKRIDFDFSMRCKIILYGRITPSKGQLIALRALNMLIKQGYKNISLEIMGSVNDNLYYEVLKKFILDNFLEKNTKFIEHSKTPFGIVRSNDIVLNCSEKEAFGRMNIEAMKIGSIIVAPKSGSSLELIKDGFNGYLYESGSFDSLANTLIKIIRTDKDCLINMGERARQYALDNFNSQVHYINLKKILEPL